MRDGGRGGAPVGQPALPLLGAVRARLGALLLGRPRRRDRGVRGERAASAGGWPAGRCRRQAAGPAGRSASRCFEAGEHERGYELMRAVGGDELEQKIPVERCFDWEMLALAELALGQPGRRRRVRRALGAERRAARPAPAGGARRAHARRGAAGDGEPQAAARPGGCVVCRTRARSAPTCRPPSRASWQVRRSPRPASRAGAVAALREAEQELDRCGSRARARRGAARAAQARRARRAARAGGRRGGRPRRADEARARDRRCS